MNNIENLNNKEAIKKLKNLVDDIIVCLFCTDLKTDDGATCRPMSAVKVCDKGNIWFFSEKNSDKNKSIVVNNEVQLFFSNPVKNSYLVVNGKALIVEDKVIIDGLWTPKTGIWFKEGKNDPNISVIKVTPSNAYYWDTDDNRMIRFLKMAASVALDTNLFTTNEGTLKI